MSLSMQHIGGLSGAMRVSGNYQTDFHQQDEAKSNENPTQRGSTENKTAGGCGHSLAV